MSIFLRYTEIFRVTVASLKLSQKSAFSFDTPAGNCNLLEVTSYQKRHFQFTMYLESSKVIYDRCLVAVYVTPLKKTHSNFDLVSERCVAKLDVY